jgi:hypothetical protein
MPQIQICLLHTLIEIDSEGRLRTKLYDKRDDFNFPMVNFPFICSNIPAAPAYGVYISQLMRYSRACGSCHDFRDRGLPLTRKLLNQGFLLIKLKSSLLQSPPWLGWPLWNFCVANDHGYIPLLNTSRSFPHAWLFTGFLTILTWRVPLVEQEMPTLSEHLSASPVFSGVPVRVNRSLVLCVCFVDRCLSFWPLCCLFFDIRIMITPLVSSNSSYTSKLTVKAG